MNNCYFLDSLSEAKRCEIAEGLGYVCLIRQDDYYICSDVPYPTRLELATMLNDHEYLFVDNVSGGIVTQNNYLSGFLTEECGEVYAVSHIAYMNNKVKNAQKELTNYQNSLGSQNE